MTLSLRQRIAFDPPQWEPKEGDFCEGEIVSIKWIDSTKGPGQFSVVKLLCDPQKMTGWRLSLGTVQDRELRQQDAQVGDRLGVLYLGKATRKSGGNPYNNLELLVEKPATEPATDD